jgi:hypothetical protein
VTDAEACAAEIIALHRLFEAWLGQGAGDFARFESAFDPAFVMVMPDGRRLDRAGVLGFLRGAGGVRGAGFRIAIEAAAPLHAMLGLVLMHYVERQWFGAVETARRAAALFRLAPEGPRWLFVQETWIIPPPA